MSSNPTPTSLSVGTLDTIFESKNCSLAPVVQVLCTKAMSNGRLRAVINDGRTLFQHCIITEECTSAGGDDGKLLAAALDDKYAVVRLKDYSISSLPKKDNMPVLLVNQLEVIKLGKDVGKKIEGNESFSGGAVSAPPAPLSTSNVANRSATEAVSRPPLSAQSKPSNGQVTTTARPATGQLNTENVCPVNILTPFYNAWVIRVRVTSKTPLKTYSNAKGSGKLFNFDTVDESGELRITAFNAEADKFYDLIERGKVYLISKGSVKPANKRFSSLNADYEVTLNNFSIIEPVEEGSGGEGSSIPKLRFKFVPLADVENLAAGTMIDVIGVIRSVGQAELITSKKTGKELTKREFSLVDCSLAEARVTLWNEPATCFAADPGEVVALKGAIVGDFKGKTLSTTASTAVELEPEVPERAVLRNWFTSQGPTANFTSLSNAGGGGGAAGSGKVDASNRFICQITPALVEGNASNANSTGGGSANTYSSVNGTISATSRNGNHLYKSCASEAGCLKKVTDEAGDGMYYCAKCDRARPSFKWRLMLSVAIADATGSAWVTIFQENAEKLLGHSAEELARLQEEEPAQYAAAINRIRFDSYYFRLGSRMEEYNGERRVRSSLYTVAPHQPLDRSRRLLAMIAKMEQQV